eukprot:TRINITY_DN6700_c4_g1_i1.p1 TRINITY_DN6700_c4_g1~~TRINITY_DN6700_c4_g1_i1.p1  ORF type:complete len:591 (+),score=267.25 TRINITY_DN6700_c4_g1_i1:56-1774(+)
MADVAEDLPYEEGGTGFDDDDDDDGDIAEFIADDWNDADNEGEEGGDETLDQALKSVKLQKDRDVPPVVRPTITRQPEVIDDFVRNFLVNKGMTSTLEQFEAEWYELGVKEHAEGEESNFIVPDTYIHNSKLIEELSLTKEELDRLRESHETLQAKFGNIQKQRDFHKLSHKRVVQEKGKLLNDLKRLQAHNNTMEPLLVELRQKNESVMKERMLIRLEKEKLQAKVKSLEDMVNKLEGAPKAQTIPTTTEKKKRREGAAWPADYRAPTVQKAVAPPSNLTSMSCRTTLKGHSMTVTAVAVHPKKPVVASASDDAVWKVWAIPSGDLILSGDGHTDWVSGVAFNPRATHVATCSGDKTVKVWDILKASCVHTFTDHTQAVWDVAWHDHGDFLASASLDHTVRIWDTSVGKQRQTLRGHVDSVNSVQFQNDSNFVITASGDKTLSLWDPRTGFCVHTFYGHNNAVNHASFANQGQQVASVDADGMVMLWDLRTVSELARESCGSHPNNCVVFDRSDQNLAIGSDDGMIYLQNIAERKISTLRGHEDAVQAVAFAPDNTYMVSASSDATAKYWC